MPAVGDVGLPLDDKVQRLLDETVARASATFEDSLCPQRICQSKWGLQQNLWVASGSGS